MLWPNKLDLIHKTDSSFLSKHFRQIASFNKNTQQPCWFCISFKKTVDYPYYHVINPTCLWHALPPRAHPTTWLWVRCGCQVPQVSNVSWRRRILVVLKPSVAPQVELFFSEFFVTFLGGGNSNILYFQPYLGKISNLTYIFQMGWNHQLAFVCFMCVFLYNSPKRVQRIHLQMHVFIGVTWICLFLQIVPWILFWDSSPNILSKSKLLICGQQKMVEKNRATKYRFFRMFKDRIPDSDPKQNRLVLCFVRWNFVKVLCGWSVKT